MMTGHGPGNEEFNFRVSITDSEEESWRCPVSGGRNGPQFASLPAAGANCHGLLLDMALFSCHKNQKLFKIFRHIKYYGTFMEHQI
jgi:hypothetical protein